MNSLPCSRFDPRCFAEIQTDAILHNFDTLAALLPPETKKMAVVKADAYGHGAIPVAKALESRADYFAVAAFSEALALRSAGIAKPILILAPVSPRIYPSLVEQDVTATIFDLEEAQELSEISVSMNRKARVHVAVDTGMGRIGVLPDQAGADTVVHIAALEGIELEGVFSHYAYADAETPNSALEQETRFDTFLSLLEERGVRPALRHICNSAGSLRMKKKYDLCRFGISLYGYPPSDEMTVDVPLRPAMTVKSTVNHVKTVEKGTKIGYGHSYVAPEKKRVATVSIGYGDGYNRCISEQGYVLLHGKRAKILGRICMDQIMVDATDIPEVKVGSQAVILGKDGNEEISASLLGTWAHSFSYEVLCTFLPRVQRIYK